MMGMGNMKDAWSLLKTAAVQLGLNQRSPAIRLNTCLAISMCLCPPPRVEGQQNSVGM